MQKIFYGEFQNKNETVLNYELNKLIPQINIINKAAKGISWAIWNYKVNRSEILIWIKIPVG